MVGGLAYIQSLKHFRELFNIHKNDAPHERQQPEGTETMSLFDGHTRVALTTQKQTATREVHREASLLGNGLAQVNDEERHRERRQGRGGGRGGNRDATATQNTHSQLDTHAHLRLIASVVEPDVHHWSYWLSRLGCETRKVERTLWNHTATL